MDQIKQLSIPEQIRINAAHLPKATAEPIQKPIPKPLKGPHTRLVEKKRRELAAQIAEAVKNQEAESGISLEQIEAQGPEEWLEAAKKSDRRTKQPKA
jgi:hypothetical protein